ncbi:hypothetical protein JCM10295v2_003155 [Rhodotorula toruloides]
MDWVGGGDEASFTKAAEISTNSWVPRNSVKAPIKTAGSKLKTVIVRLLKDGVGLRQRTELRRPPIRQPRRRSSAAYPGTPAAAFAPPRPDRRVPYGRNTRGSIADSLPASSESEHTDPSQDGEASEPPYLNASPFLNRYRYIEAIPDPQKDAVSEEQLRLLTNRDPRKAFQRAHILPKRLECSQLIPQVPKDAHDNFDDDHISFLSVSRILDILL